MRRCILLVLAMLAGCGKDDNVHHLPDAPCAPGMAPVTVTGPDAYACHEQFKSAISVTNNSCTTLEVSAVQLSGAVTTGGCAPTGLNNYTPMKKTVAPGKTVVVLDLTGGVFCCIAPGPCPTPFQCDETFTFQVVTDAGTFAGTSNAHLSLDGCPEVCPGT